MFDSLTVDFELNLGAVNEPQTVEAPAATQPLSALLQRLNIDPGRLGDSSGRAAERRGPARDRRIDDRPERRCSSGLPELPL